MACYLSSAPAWCWGQIGRIDHALPVPNQKVAARTTLYIRSGMQAGLPWWFFGSRSCRCVGHWAMSTCWRRRLRWCGAVTASASWPARHLLVHRWARRGTGRVRRKMDDNLTGGSLRKRRRGVGRTQALRAGMTREGEALPLPPRAAAPTHRSAAALACAAAADDRPRYCGQISRLYPHASAPQRWWFAECVPGRRPASRLPQQP